RAFADRVMIEQVVLNLVKNALDAMEQTPAGHRHLSITAGIDADERILVAVKDTGAGFSQNAEAQIFSPFFTTKPEGMGIGLSICRSIIEYHDGRLSFAGNAEGGAAFSFTLPTAEWREPG
ncbi:MAG: ATP-binding protein, partial [Dongiaceae bacterium]